MTREQISSLLETITDKVCGDDKFNSGCAPVTLSIGYVAKTRIVLHDGIVITDAPAAIINVVMDWVHDQRQKDPHCQVHAEAGVGGMIIR